MKKTYVVPSMEVETFSFTDILTSSGIQNDATVDPFKDDTGEEFLPQL